MGRYRWEDGKTVFKNGRGDVEGGLVRVGRGHTSSVLC